MVPVLCSGFLWADGCADSNYCEVSSSSYFPYLSFVFLRIGFSVFLLLLAVVDYLMKCFHIARHLAAKFGTNSWFFDLMGLLHYV